MALTAAERNAITRALAHGGARAVTRVRDGVYAVRSASRTGVAHTVTAAGVYWCTCEAGQHERVCWHQAAVFVARVEGAGGARVTGAAAAVAERMAGQYPAAA
jgi:hypothetical protein